MKIKIVGVVLILAWVFCPQASAVQTWDFYTDQTFDSQRNFDGTVNIHDSAVITMTGGTVAWFNTYNSSLINFQDGLIAGSQLYNSSTLNIYGGIDYDVEANDTSTINMYGGQISSYLIVRETAFANIYGYNFNFIESGSSWFLFGNWANGVAFRLYLRMPVTRTRVTLHEIPEPAGLILLSLGGILLRKRRS